MGPVKGMGNSAADYASRGLAKVPVLDGGDVEVPVSSSIIPLIFD